MGYPSEPPTLDPLVDGGAASTTRDILRPMLPALFSLDEDLKPVEELAAWPQTDDITFDPFTVRLTLRDARWSDSRPVTGEDVAFSFDKLKQGPTGHRYEVLREVRVVSPQRIELEFKQIVRRWWALFSVDDMILPAHAYSSEWDDGPTVTSGPMRFDGWTKGLEVRMRADTSHYAAPKLGGVDVVFVPDDETRLELLERGELDLLFAEGEVNIGRRATARGFEPQGVFGPTWYELEIDAGDVGANVAAAIVEAIHPTLAAEIFEDSGRPANGISPVFPEPEAPTAEPWRRRGNLNEAKARLGSGGKRSFQIAYARGTPGVIARYMHFRLMGLGLRGELLGIEADAFERLTDDPDDPPAAVVLRLRRGADAPDASWYASRTTSDAIGASRRATREEVGSGPAVGLSRAEWAQAQRDLESAKVIAPLVKARSWIVAREGVEGMRVTGASNGPLWNVAVWDAA